LSLRFFQDLGFTVSWKSPEMSVLRKDACCFFLQNYHNQDMQDNFMMNLDVENLDDHGRIVAIHPEFSLITVGKGENAAMSSLAKRVPEPAAFGRFGGIGQCLSAFSFSA
jgi:hypothetical protein